MFSGCSIPAQQESVQPGMDQGMGAGRGAGNAVKKQPLTESCRNPRGLGMRAGIVCPAQGAALCSESLLSGNADFSFQQLLNAILLV